MAHVRAAGRHGLLHPVVHQDRRRRDRWHHHRHRLHHQPLLLEPRLHGQPFHDQRVDRRPVRARVPVRPSGRRRRTWPRVRIASGSQPDRGSDLDGDRRDGLHHHRRAGLGALHHLLRHPFRRDEGLRGTPGSKCSEVCRPLHQLRRHGPQPRRQPQPDPHLHP